MKILHISPHVGGGLGTVIQGWTDCDKTNKHEILLLDIAKTKRKMSVDICDNAYALIGDIRQYMGSEEFDIVVVHWYDHPMLATLFADSIPDCRLVFWCHKNITATMFNPVWWDRVLNYPDRFINTSPIQGCGCEHIWSTGNMDRFLAIEPKPHKGFNIGYVGTVDYKKLHPKFLAMCLEIMKHIPDVHFTVIGEHNIGITEGHDDRFTFTGKVDDVAPYLAEMDIFGYPLRPDHYGTCEIALGEALAAGVVPVVMDNPAERLIVSKKHTPGGLTASNENNYCRGIEALYHNNEFQRGFSTNARNRAKELYDIDTMIRQWDDIFAEMMQKPKTRRNPL